MNHLTLSKDGADKLIAREGKRNKAYRDTKGIWTIGVGHTGPEVTQGLVWSDEQVMKTFKEDVKWAEAAVNSCTHPLKQHQFDALVSFVFNIGAGAWHKSTMKKLLQLGNVEAATQQFDRWRFPPEILGRRMQEKAQFSGR
jgi:lysozyme